MLNVDKIRADFPFLSGANAPIYLDNGATTQKPVAVLEAITDFYRHGYANVHRGDYALSRKAAELFERCRGKIADFIGADGHDQIIFTAGATSAINLAASSFSEHFLHAGNNIVISALEHHSNFIPWQAVCYKKDAELRVVPCDKDGAMNIDFLKKFIDDKTAIVAVTAAANTTGAIMPVKEITDLAHQRDIPVLVDGAQAIAHEKINVEALDVDFFCFSGHKLYAPTGIGVLYGKRHWLDAMAPYQYGGDMVDRLGATFNEDTFQALPHKFEAGTQNLAGAIGLAAAIAYLEGIGASNIKDYGDELTDYAIGKLAAIPGLEIIGLAQKRVPIISFLIDGFTVAEIGSYLNKHNIAVRSGEHCSQSTMKCLGVDGTVRISFAIYNTKMEIDLLVDALATLVKRKKLTYFDN